MSPPGCPVCGGTEEGRLVQLLTVYRGRPVLVEDVPALVCAQCGEETFDAHTVKRIETLLDHGPSPRRTVEPPVLSLGTA